MEEIRTGAPLPCCLSNVSYIRISREAGHRVAFPNGKPDCGFICVRDGSLVYEIAGLEGKTKVLAGEVLYLPAQTKYTCTYGANGAIVEHLRFSAQKPLPSFLQKPFSVSQEQIASVFRALPAASCADPYTLSSAIYRIFSILSPKVLPEYDSYAALSPALEAFRTNPESTHDIGWYARLCAMSETNFRRSFRACTGCSPIAYRNRLRLEKADLLLASGEYTVEEAAQEAGFHNMSFYYALRKRSR